MDVDDEHTKEYELKKKRTEMNSAQLGKWYNDTDDKDLLWRVVERRKKNFVLSSKNTTMPKDESCGSPR